jgi:hypothetical protein
VIALGVNAIGVNAENVVIETWLAHLNLDAVTKYLKRWGN